MSKKNKQPKWEVVPFVERTQEDVDSLNKAAAKQREEELLNKIVELQAPIELLKESYYVIIKNKIKFFIKDIMSLFTLPEWYCDRLKLAIQWKRTIDYDLIYTDVEWYLINIVYEVCVLSQKDTEILRVTRAILSPREVEDCSDEEFDKLHAEKMQLKSKFYKLLPDLSFNIY